MNNTINGRSKRKWAIIAFWVVMIAISFTFRDRLSTGIIESTSLTDTTTQAGKGQVLYEERFNITSETATQVIVIELNNTQDITSPQWRAFTLYLTFYLNHTYFSHNYTQIYSEPLLLLANQPDIASSFVSKDKTVGLIYLTGRQDQLNDFKKDVKEIRQDLSDINNNPQILYNFANLTFFAQYHMSLPPNSLPGYGDIKGATLILTGSLANFADILNVAKEALDS